VKETGRKRCRDRDSWESDDFSFLFQGEGSFLSTSLSLFHDSML
jgi:hypothetical protein